MQLGIKGFAKRLNQCLEEIGAPVSSRDRATFLSKLAGIPKQIAWGLVEGHHSPSPDLIQQLASEFEVETSWLIGEK